MGTDHLRHNLAMRYQFWLDGQPAAPLRDDWEAAVDDAIAAGYARWANLHELTLDEPRGASIARIRGEQPVPPAGDVAPTDTAADTIEPVNGAWEKVARELDDLCDCLAESKDDRRPWIYFFHLADGFRTVFKAAYLYYREF